MNNPFPFGRRLCPILVGMAGLLSTISMGLAAPGGAASAANGAAANGAASNGGNSGAAASSAGASSVGSAGLSRGSGSTVGASSHASAPAVGATRGGSGQNSSVAQSNGPVGIPAHSSVNASGTGSISGSVRAGANGYVVGPRSPYGNGTAGAGRGSIPSISRRFDGTVSPTGVFRGQYAARSSETAEVRAPSNNAWTDPRISRLAPAARVGRYGYNGAYDAGQSYLQNQRAAGQYLYPGAYGYSASENARNGVLKGNHGRNPERRFHNHHFFNAFYYPYFYGGFFPGYYGAFNGVSGDYSGLDSDATYGAADTNADADSAPMNAGGEHRYQNRTLESVEPADDPALPPDQPTNIGPQNPGATEQRTPVEQGPDSLVEAVQNELSKRGYLAGRVDAVYGEPTKEALRRFQADRRLNVTGRINEATLHALDLD